MKVTFSQLEMIKPWQFVMAVGIVAAVIAHYYSMMAILELQELTDPGLEQWVGEGWFFGLKRDGYDGQWGAMRGGAALVLGMFIIHTAVSRFWLGNRPWLVRRRAEFFFAIFIVYIVHGVYAIWIFIPVIVTYLISRMALNDKLRPYAIPLIWAFTIFWALLADFTDNLKIESLPDNPLITGRFSWAICYRLVVLRLISYVTDFVWSFDKEKYVPAKPYTDDVHAALQEAAAAALATGRRSVLSTSGMSLPPVDPLSDDLAASLLQPDDGQGGETDGPSKRVDRMMDTFVDALEVQPQSRRSSVLMRAWDGKILYIDDTERDWVGEMPNGETVSSLCKKSLHSIHFDFINLCLYACHMPVYLAGPTMPFNFFLNQVRNKPTPPNEQPEPVVLERNKWAIYKAKVLPYFLRVCIDVLCLEVFSHVFHANALISLDSRLYPELKWELWAKGTPSQLVASATYSLLFTWLMYTSIWRFCRVWSMSGSSITPPENMLRCIMSSISVSRFWRAWHQSFNIWLVRYLYLPLQGNTRSQVKKILIGGLVFTYVAMWHYRTWFMFAWGMFMFAGMTVETLVSTAWCAKIHPRPKRHTETANPTANIMHQQPAVLLSEQPAGRVSISVPVPVPERGPWAALGVELVESMGCCSLIVFLFVGNLVGYCFHLDGLVRLWEMIQESADQAEDGMEWREYLGPALMLFGICFSSSWVGRGVRGAEGWAKKW